MLQMFVDLLKGGLEFIIFDITLEIFSMYKRCNHRLSKIIDSVD